MMVTHINQVLLVLVPALIMLYGALALPLVYKMQETDAVTFVSRKEWGACPPIKTTPLKTPVPFVVVHHTDTQSCFSKSDCSKLVRSIQNFHMDTRHWSDIGYNFLIGQDGMVYIGRGWDTLGAHAKGFNDQSIGIAFLGTFMSDVPNQKALTALKELIDNGLKNGKVKTDYTLVGHRQTNYVGYTTCPGDALLCVIAKWPHWKPYQKIGKFVMPKCNY